MRRKEGGRLMDKRRKDGTYPFEYTPSHSTDVRKTFERVKSEGQQEPPRVARLVRKP